MKSVDLLVTVPLPESTSTGLLARVKLRDESAWGRLVQVYGPMVYRWVRRAGVSPHDAPDITQNVFVSVASDIGRFRRTQPGDSFRGWLHTICRNKVLDYFREQRQEVIAQGGTTAQTRLQQLAAPVESSDESANDETCRLRHRALALLRNHFEDRVWQAILRTLLHGDRPADVAGDLGLAVSTVYRARGRVLALLRAELEGL